MLEKIIEFLVNNKEWIFDGIGVLVLSSLFALLFAFGKFLFGRKKKSDLSNMKQINKNTATGTQIGIQNNYYEREKDEE